MIETKSKLSRLFLHFFFFLKKHLAIILLLIVISLLFVLGQSGLGLLARFKLGPADLLGFFGNTNERLSNQGGVTNFLLLGLRGEGQDSPDLTDSIIVISYNENNKKITQIGVPRDLWVPSLQAKINTAYHYGEVASPSSGIKLAEASISEVLGLPINYSVVVNFNLFIKLIDLVGGIDLNIAKGFEDKEFPIVGRENALPISSRYETISFSQGPNHLNGETALKYVRSRHSEGEEGTDFARSARQQQVISSLKDKLFNKDFLLDKDKLNKLISLTEENIKTNLPSSLYPVLARIGLDQKGKSLSTVVLSSTPDSNGVSILYTPPTAKYKGEWVLMPKDNNWKALKQYIESNLSN